MVCFLSPIAFCTSEQEGGWNLADIQGYNRQGVRKRVAVDPRGPLPTFQDISTRIELAAMLLVILKNTSEVYKYTNVILYILS